MNLAHMSMWRDSNDGGMDVQEKGEIHALFLIIIILVVLIVISTASATLSAAGARFEMMLETVIGSANLLKLAGGI